ncbi:unnamed protein product [Peniophora sp. CBMAI 1063]|nr:unnamed protein product [Peniophora sp. CBMAI 1063]
MGYQISSNMVPSELILEMAEYHFPAAPPPLARLDLGANARFLNDRMEFNETLHPNRRFAAERRIPEPPAFHTVRGRLGWIGLLHMSRHTRSALDVPQFWAASIGRLPPSATLDMLDRSAGRPLDVYLDSTPCRAGDSRMTGFLLNGTVPLARVSSFTFVDVRVGVDPDITILPFLSLMLALQSVDFYAALSEQGRGHTGPPPAPIRFSISDITLPIQPCTASFTNFVARVRDVTHLSILQTFLGGDSQAWAVTREELLHVLSLSCDMLQPLRLNIMYPAPILPANSASFDDFAEAGDTISVVRRFAERLLFPPDAEVEVHGFCIENVLLREDDIAQYFAGGGLAPATFCSINAPEVKPESAEEYTLYRIRVRFSTAAADAALTFRIRTRAGLYTTTIASQLDSLVSIVARSSPSGVSLYAPHVEMPGGYQRAREGMHYSQVVTGPIATAPRVKHVWRPQGILVG